MRLRYRSYLFIIQSTKGVGDIVSLTCLRYHSYLFIFQNTEGAVDKCVPDMYTL